MSEKLEIKAEVAALAEQLREGATFENGKVTLAEDIFKTSLPDGIDTDMIRKVDHHKQNFAAAQAIVVGEIAAKEFAANKELTEVTSVVRLPVGSSVTNVLREKVTRDPSTGNETTHVNYASARIVLKTPAGTIKAVRQHLLDAAKEAGIVD